MDSITYKVEVDSDGSRYWYLNDERHREDGPAIEGPHGYKAWYLKGIRHREDGPAREYSDGSKVWYLNDEVHREDGPAVEYIGGSKEWWLNSVEYTEEEFNKKMLTTVEMSIAEIAALVGKKVKVVK